MVRLYFVSALFFLVIFLNAQEGQTKTDFVSTGRIVKSFGEFDGDSYFTGITIMAPEKNAGPSGTVADIPAPEDSTLIFYSNNRKRGICYPSGNIAVLQNTNDTMRYYYHHLGDQTSDVKEQYKENEIIGRAGTSGRAEEMTLVFEIEDIKNKRYVNPLHFYPREDTLAPRLFDLFFVDKNSEIISLNTENKLVRGGRLFLQCKDSITTRSYYIEPIDYVAPYKISVFIDGKETSTITFDYIYKKENRLTLGDTNMTFAELYASQVEANYFILDYTALPGLVSIKVIVQDINGNEKRFIKAIRILPPVL